MLEITGQDCYEFGGAPNPFNPLKWETLSPQEKEAWEAVARHVVAMLDDMPANLAAFFEVLSKQVCPFCPLFLPEDTELWEQIGDEFFGSPAIFEGIHCCESCYNVLHLMSRDGNDDVQQMVAQVKGASSHE